MTEPAQDSHADWNRVGEAFTALGDRIQAHFSQLTKSAAPSQTSQTQPFEDLGKSLDAALTSFRTAVNDPSVGDAAKSASDRLLDAIRTEVASVSDSVSKTVGEAGQRTAEALPPSSDEAS